MKAAEYLKIRIRMLVCVGGKPEQGYQAVLITEETDDKDIQSTVAERGI